MELLELEQSKPQIEKELCKCKQNENSEAGICLNEVCLPEPQSKKPSEKKFSRRLNFHSANIEAIVPMFTGMLGAFIFCAFIAVHSNFFPGFHEEDFAEILLPAPEVEIEVIDSSFLSVKETAAKDPVLEYFQNDEYYEWVIDFFAGICSSRETALAILENSNEFEVPAALAFALSWEESKYNPRAVNRSNRDGSIDRGLFQLNNRSFPNLETSVFFDVEKNAYYGISHLKHCLDSSSTEIAALAMYNAGTGRVKSSGAPEVTLNYVSRILENRSKIESRFYAMLIKKEEARIFAEQAEEEEEEETETENRSYFRRTLISASPL